MLLLNSSCFLLTFCVLPLTIDFATATFLGRGVPPVLAGCLCFVDSFVGFVGLVSVIMVLISSLEWIPDDLSNVKGRDS